MATGGHFRRRSAAYQSQAGASFPLTPIRPNAAPGARTANGEMLLARQPGSISRTSIEDSLEGGHLTSNSSTSLAQKFSLSADPATWGSARSLNEAEADDDLHNPDPKRDRSTDGGSNFFSRRGFSNLGCLFLLVACIVSLFAAYPIVNYIKKREATNNSKQVLGANSTGQVPSMGNWGLIDNDTPKDAYTKPSYADGSEWQLVFSDEFNTDGRSFYPGDDPYWEAVDLHYWSTGNLEWYDPAAITTANGSLEITLSKKETHGLNYQGGMMTSWNKFCFTGGMIETSVMLPGSPNILGLWPAIWTMGNLGRAGYGASTDGTWPYSYDSCDVGTVANQSINGAPVAATNTGGQYYNTTLSYLTGQRLSRCTCPGESHPGPMHSDGTYVGRSAPEIDIFEAQIGGDPLTGAVSQSGQWAPFDDEYAFSNTSENYFIADPSVSVLNSYRGSIYQQATSVVTNTDQNCYETEAQCYSVYGFEYKPGFDGAYISWIANGKLAWTIQQAGMGANPVVNISSRPVPQEPMYILINLAQSYQFQWVDEAHIPYPATMKVDYIRVYQPKNATNVGCDPPDFPTAAYIQQYLPAYENWNLTTWVDDFKQTIPKNRFLGQC